MKKDPHTSVSTLGDFLGYPLSKDVVSRIVEQTTFSNMKLNPAANNSWMEKYHNEGATPFMRKGIIGDWKNYFSDEQSARMDALVNEKLAGTGLHLTMVHNNTDSNNCTVHLLLHDKPY